MREISSASGLLNAALAIKANQGSFGSLGSYVVRYRYVRGATAAPRAHPDS
jgi:hypothetical protein